MGRREQAVDNAFIGVVAGIGKEVVDLFGRGRKSRKIERDPSRPTFVITVWGVGYKFVNAPVPTVEIPR